MLPRERTHRIVPPGPASARDRKDEVVTLQLRDLIDRLPVAFLAPGEYDAEQGITFEIADLAQQIAEGRPTLNLTEVQRQIPNLFAREIRSLDNFLVRFPWQKLVAMLCAADSAHPSPGLTRTGALHLARLLRWHRGHNNTSPAVGRAPAGTAALARAPQWFVRSNELSEAPPVSSSQESDRSLHELALALEHLANPPATGGSAHLVPSAEPAPAIEEIARLQKQLAERDRQVDSLRKALADLESAAIDQIAALNQHCDEIAATASAPPPAAESPLNPQQSAMIETLSHQIAELYAELDRAREETLLATAAHARHREQQEASDASAKALAEYLASVAYELERANATLKDMESKLHHAEVIASGREAELKRLTEEVAELRLERDALRGRLYAMSPRDPAPPQTMPANGTEN